MSLHVFSNRLLRTYPILVDDIDDDHQLASMGSERDVGYAADLNETFEHLDRTKQEDDGSWLHSFCV